MTHPIVEKAVSLIPFRTGLPDTLRQKLDVLHSEEAQLTLTYQELALAAADGDKPQAEADKAHAALMAHHANVARAEAALAAATRREDAARRELEASTTAAAWNKCVDASRACEPIAVEYAATLAKAGKLFAQLREAVRLTHHAVPPGVGSNDQDGYFPDLNALTRCEYSTHGLPEGVNPWGSTLPSLVSQVAGHTKRIERARDEALRGSVDAQEPVA
jgi:hypothetical protein